jgi:hypothetical protein
MRFIVVADEAIEFSSPQELAPPRRTLWPITKIADRDGVSRQVVSKHVQRLIGRGLSVERNNRGRVEGVDVVEYYRLLGRPFDPAEVDSQSTKADNRRGHAMRDAERVTARLIDRLPSHAREIAAAVARDGEAGAAGALKALAFDLRKDVVEALRKIVAPALDDVHWIE